MSKIIQIVSVPTLIVSTYRLMLRPFKIKKLSKIKALGITALDEDGTLWELIKTKDDEVDRGSINLACWSKLTESPCENSEE
jgi:hypothetical protein